MPTDSGHDLLNRATGGNHGNFNRLLKEHGPALRQCLGQRIPARWQAVLSPDDLMQQTYTDVFLHVERFVPEGEGSFRAWVLTIANRNLVDALRMLEAEKRGEDRRRIQPDTAGDSFVALYELLSSGATTPSQDVARREARTALGQAIQRLPEVYRRVVQMFDLDGRSMEEVAQAVGRSRGAAYMIRARAHRRLQELMGNPSKYLSNV